MTTIRQAAYMCAICNEELASSVEFRQHIKQGCDSSLQLIDIRPCNSRQGAFKPDKAMKENNNNVPVKVESAIEIQNNNRTDTCKQYFEEDYDLAVIETGSMHNTTDPLNVFSETMKDSAAKCLANINLDTVKTLGDNVDQTNIGFEKLIRECACFRCCLCGENFNELNNLSEHVRESCSALRSNIIDTKTYSLKRGTSKDLRYDTTPKRNSETAKHMSFFQAMPPAEQGPICYKCPVCKLYFSDDKDLSCHFIFMALYGEEPGSTLKQHVALDGLVSETHREMIIYHCSSGVNEELKCNLCLRHCRSFADFVEHVASYSPGLKNAYFYSSKNDTAINFIHSFVNSSCKTFSNEDNTLDSTRMNKSESEKRTIKSNKRKRIPKSKKRLADVKQRLIKRIQAPMWRPTEPCIPEVLETEAEQHSQDANHNSRQKSHLLDKVMEENINNVPVNVESAIERPSEPALPEVIEIEAEQRSQDANLNMKHNYDKSQVRFGQNQTDSIEHSSIDPQCNRWSENSKNSCQSETENSYRQATKNLILSYQNDPNAISSIKARPNPTQGPLQSVCLSPTQRHLQRVCPSPTQGPLQRVCLSPKENMRPRPPQNAHLSTPRNMCLRSSQKVRLNSPSHSRHVCSRRDLKRRKTRQGFMSGYSYHRCEHCNHLYSSVLSMKVHIHSHFQTPIYRIYGCDHCNHVLSSINRLENHVRFHFKLTDSNGGKERCDHCNHIFSSSRRLKFHVKSHFHKKVCVCVGCTGNK